MLGIREDGYHDIRSVMHTVDLCDSLDIVVTRGSGNAELECDSAEVPGGADNTALVAAVLFLEETGLDMDVVIRLRKRIPSRAGLGGGSSDAACVLSALSRMTGARPDLHRLACMLGSDVPFFLSGGCALVEGRGERLTHLRPLSFHAVLIHPEVRVSTAEAYAMLDESRRGDSLTSSAGIRHYPASSAVWHEGKPFPYPLDNDFLPLLVEKRAGIAEAASLLESAEVPWGLSGSGSTLFALFGSGSDAGSFSSSLPAGTRSTVCRSLPSAGASSNW